MRSISRKALATLLCLALALALMPAIGPLSGQGKAAFAADANESNYLIFTTTNLERITPVWTEPGVSIRYTTLNPATSSPNWTEISSGTPVVVMNGSIYFEGHTTNKTLYTDDEVSNRWDCIGVNTISGTPNALLKDAYGGPAYTGTLANYAFAYMFFQQDTLAGSVTLPSTGLGQFCYNNMFNNCTSLTSAPVLPATRLAKNCYSYMFYHCSALVNPPALPATRLEDYCYSAMFSYCTSLTNAPSLPAHYMYYSCYAGMFSGCTSLALAPDLPATGLATDCYDEMFSGCTSLTIPPDLPATMILANCYASMFANSHIEVSGTKTSTYTRAWRIPTTGAATNLGGGWTFENLGWNTDMLAGSNGPFKSDPDVNTTYYVKPKDQPKPGCSGTLPTAYHESTTIAGTGSLAGVGYTVTSNNQNISITTTDNVNFTVQVNANVGSTYSISVVAKGNDSYKASSVYVSASKTIVRADQDKPDFSGNLPTAYHDSASITPSGSVAGAGYTVTSSDESVATVSGSGDGPFTVQVGGNVGSTYRIYITAKGNDNYRDSETFSSDEKTVGKANQTVSGFSGDLPTIYGDSAEITPTGSVTGEGYTVTSSDDNVATVSGSGDGPFTVQVVGKGDERYRIAIVAKGNDNYKDSEIYSSDEKTVGKANQTVSGFIGDLPTACGAFDEITPTGSSAGAGYTVTSSDESVATVSGSGDGPFTVQVGGNVGSTYRIYITAKGNDNYRDSETFSSDPQTVGKGSQPLPGIDGTLPTVQGSVAVITPIGSLAEAGDEGANPFLRRICGVGNGGDLGGRVSLSRLRRRRGR
jgi:hypothetical protein